LQQESLFIMIYLDNHTATKPSQKIAKKRPDDLWLSPGAPYFNDSEVVREMERGIGNLYDLTGACKDSRVIITSGDHETASYVFNKVFCEVVYSEGKNFLLAPVIENASIRKSMESLSKVGCQSKYLPVNKRGELTVEILEKHYTPKAGILALSWANPLTGAIHPVEELAEYCKKKGILLYVQGSEMIGKLFCRIADLPIDYFSFSADLIHGPKGISALFTKEKKEEFELSSVTNLPGLIGMGIAAGEVLDFMDGMNTETAYLRSLLEDGLAKLIPGVQFFGVEGRRLPNTCCFAIPSIHAEYFTFLLSQKGLLLSYGGCRMQKLEYMLQEMHVPPGIAKSAVSATLSMETTESEIKKALEIISETVNDSWRVAL